LSSRIEFSNRVVKSSFSIWLEFLNSTSQFNSTLFQKNFNSIRHFSDWVLNLNLSTQLDAISLHEQNNENEEENAEEKSDKDNMNDSLWMRMSQVEFIICMFNAYAKHMWKNLCSSCHSWYMHDLWLCCFLDASLKLYICTTSIFRSCCLSFNYFSYIVLILQLMICICRKLSRDWNNFELMVSICRKLSRGRNPKKKVSALAQLFQTLTNCNPSSWSATVHIVGWLISEIVRLPSAQPLHTSGTGPRGHGSCRSRDSDAGYQAKGAH